MRCPTGAVMRRAPVGRLPLEGNASARQPGGRRSTPRAAHSIWFDLHRNTTVQRPCQPRGRDRSSGISQLFQPVKILAIRDEQDEPEGRLRRNCAGLAKFWPNVESAYILI